MKFALLGDDPVVLPLVRVLAEHSVHRLTAAALLEDRQAEVLGLVPSVRMVSGWEELIPADLDAVIVCGSADVIGEGAKQLAASGRPLVVFPQGTWDTELIYELSLVRDDNAVKLIPIQPRLLLPAFQEYQKELTSSPMDEGKSIQHLRWEWEVKTEPGRELPRDVIRSYLLPDVSLLRMLGGEYHQVTAVESATRTGGIVLATVTLTGQNLPDAVWSLKPGTGPSRWKLMVTHSTGTTTFEGSENPWDIVATHHAQDQSEPAATDAGQLLLKFIERRLTMPEERPDWTDFTRDFEVLDAVRRSLARRRTIDLHFETTSERSLFKTQMTAMGCGVLMLTLLAVVALLFLGSVLDARKPVEIAADKADTIFYDREFEPAAENLTPSGIEHWDRVATERRDPTLVPILVEQVDGDLSDARKEHLVGLLNAEDIPHADQRVEVHELDGPWFKTLMKIARILVFLPLFLFLGLQLLLLITRPAQSHRKPEETA